MKLILKNLLLSSLLAFALASDEETNSQQFLRKLQTAAKIVSKTSDLGLCEGDCSNDASCRGDLVCHQRNAGDSAPGCSLTSNQRKSRADFCVAARGGSPNPAPVAAPVRSPPTGGGGGGGGGNSFALKLYWQSGKKQSCTSRQCIRWRCSLIPVRLLLARREKGAQMVLELQGRVQCGQRNCHL
jgi:hypothetical protein